MKQAEALKTKKPQYEDIPVPKNTPIGIFIGGFSFLFGFAMIWHITWLAPISLLGVIGCMIIRLSDEDTEYSVSAEEVEKIESGNRNQYA
jgi:cytochrome o ubiquinol oxidase subunit I